MSAKFNQPAEPVPFTTRYLLVPKLLYFTMNLAFYCCYAFRPKYLKQAQDIDNKDYGMVAAFISLVVFFSNGFWTAMMDRFGHAKLILIGSAFTSAVVFQLFLVKFDNPALKIPVSAAISCVYVFFVYSFIPLCDSICMYYLTTTPGADKTLYGRQRLFGCFAYIIATLTVGVGFKHSLVPSVNILVAILSGLFALVVFFFLEEPKRPEKKVKDVEKVNEKVEKSEKKADLPQVTGKGKSPFMQLITNGNFVFLIFVVFLNGFARAIMTHYAEPFQRIVFFSEQWVSAVCAVTGQIPEIIVFYFAKQLLNYFGVRRMLLISQACMVIRVCLYAFAPRDFAGKEYAPLYYDILKGIGFGTMQTAAVVWVTEIAGPETKATAVGIYTGVFAGISAFVAGLIGYFTGLHIPHVPKGLKGQELKAAEEVHRLAEVAQCNVLLTINAYFSIAAFVLFFVKYIVFEEMIQGKGQKKKNVQKA